MKTIIYVIIGVVVLWLIYKAYTNYQVSGSVFKSSGVNDSDGNNIPSSFKFGQRGVGMGTSYYIEGGKYYKKNNGGDAAIEISKDDYIAAYDFSQVV